MPLDSKFFAPPGMSSATSGRMVPFSANLPEPDSKKQPGKLVRFLSALSIFGSRGPSKASLPRAPNTDGLPFHVESMKATVDPSYR